MIEEQRSAVDKIMSFADESCWARSLFELYQEPEIQQVKHYNNEAYRKQERKRRLGGFRKEKKTENKYWTDPPDCISWHSLFACSFSAKWLSKITLSMSSTENRMSLLPTRGEDSAVKTLSSEHCMAYPCACVCM